MISPDSRMSMRAFHKERPALKADPGNFVPSGELRLSAFPAHDPSWKWAQVEESAAMFQSNKALTPRKAGLLFLSGFVSAYTGGWALKALLKKGAPLGKIALPKAQSLETKLKKQPFDMTDRYIGLQIETREATLFSAVVEHPEMLAPVLAYLIAGICGYLGASFAQGFQEAWVRREEMHIRSNLLYRLNDAFRNSLSVKYQVDDGLKASARLQILNLLKRNGVQNPDCFLQETPFPENPEIARMTAYLPYSRLVSIPFGRTFEEIPPYPLPGGSSAVRVKPGSSAAALEGERQDGEPALLRQGKRKSFALETGVFGAGATVGALLHSLTALFKTGFSESGRFMRSYRQANRKIVQSTFFNNYEAILMLSHFLGRPMLIASFGIMTGLLKLGKLFVDGLREIEVTRVHAETEYRYQALNWMKLDPSFHTLAETAELKHALCQLENDLPGLLSSPSLLHQRIQTLLANVGRSSAPKYFLMTPPVGLREARS